MKKIVWLVITIVVALALLPVISTSISDLTGDGGDLNGTAAATILDLVPFFYVVLIVLGSMLAAFSFGRKGD